MSVYFTCSVLFVSIGVLQIASFCIHNAKYMKMQRIQKGQKPVQRWTPDTLSERHFGDVAEVVSWRAS